MSARTKAMAQELGAGAAGFVLALGLGMALLLPLAGGSAPRGSLAIPLPAGRFFPAAPAAARLWFGGAPVGEKAVPFAASRIAVAPESGAGASAESGLGAAAAAQKTEALADPLRLVVKEHLNVEHQASVTTLLARGLNALKPFRTRAKPAPKAFKAPKLDASRAAGTIAAVVHYGVTSRAQLMGRAAGPVYNFGGRPLTVRAALSSMGGAQKALDASGDLSAKDKAVIDGGLRTVRRGAQ